MPEPDNTTSTPASTLPRVLGPIDAALVVVGSIIGSGVFIKATVIAKELPFFGPIIGVWIAVGLLTLCGVLALAELAAMLPQAGGLYVYLKEAYGPLPAFLWGWTEFWVSRSAGLGALACATVIFLSRVVEINSVEQEVLAIGMIVFMAAVNIVGTRRAATLQNVTVVIKVGFLAAIILLPLAMGRAHVSSLEPLWPEAASDSVWKGIGLAMIAVLWPYHGWTHVAPVAEEIREPQRNVPIGLMVGMLLVILVYVGANVSYHLVLSMDEVRESKGVASEIFQTLFGSTGAKVAAIGVMCSTFGAANTNLLTGPRIYFAMARDGLLPASLQKVHPTFQTPANAIGLQAAWTILLIIVAYAWKADPRDAFDALTDFVIFGSSIFDAMAISAIFVLRRKRPDLARPYRVWGYPVTPFLYLLMFAAVLVTLILQKWQQTVFGSVLIVAGSVWYFVTRHKSESRNS